MKHVFVKSCLIYFIIFLFSCSEKDNLTPIDKYESGKLKMECETNEKGEKVGKCLNYYENGNIKSVSYWDHDQQIKDTIKVYNKQGELIESPKITVIGKKVLKQKENPEFKLQLRSEIFESIEEAYFMCDYDNENKKLKDANPYTEKEKCQQLETRGNSVSIRFGFIEKGKKDIPFVFKLKVDDNVYQYFFYRLEVVVK